MFANALRRYTAFEMFLPNDLRNDQQREENEFTKRPMKTLFLLHGYTGDAGNWVPEYLAEQYNFAIVIPNGENAFWLDGQSTGHKFCTFLGEELPDYVSKTFGLTIDRENAGIMGLSMGGFGALHTALAYPERFGKIGAMSSALIVHEVATMTDGHGNDMGNNSYYRECFGDPAAVLQSDNNPETLVDRILEKKGNMPEIYLCCGTKDFLLENNRAFHQFLVSRNVDHLYYETEGDHNMDFWDEYTRKIIPWMFGSEGSQEL